MKYRIKIEEVQGSKFKHKHNIMIESNNLDSIILKLRKLLSSEITEREIKVLEWLTSRKKSYFKKFSEEIDEDLINWKDKGEDITREEFLENEAFFEIR